MATMLCNVLLAPVRKILNSIVDYYRDQQIKKPEVSGKYITHGLNFGRPRYTLASDIFPVRIVKGGFEKKDFYIPKNPHKYLVEYFGEDYMTVPPPEKRLSHHSFIDLGK